MKDINSIKCNKTERRWQLAVLQAGGTNDSFHQCKTQKGSKDISFYSPCFNCDQVFYISIQCCSKNRQNIHTHILLNIYV